MGLEMVCRMLYRPGLSFIKISWVSVETFLVGQSFWWKKTKFIGSFHVKVGNY